LKKNMPDRLTDRRVFLSTMPAGQGQRRLALAAVLISALFFFAAAPFAKLQLAPLPAFIPIIAATLVINDLITAVLLLGQFRFLRSRALLALACAYLFTACMTVAHALSFPGLFAPSGLLGAGPQSTAWLYVFWHSGFPLLVIAYAFLKDEDAALSVPRSRARTAALACVAAVCAVASGLVFFSTALHGALPAVMEGNRIAPLGFAVLGGSWVLSILALGVLWRRRPHSVLDLWLMVVLCAWIFDIGLSAVLNAGRYDLGFYAGRVYGLLAASFVLVVLLLESSVLHAEVLAARESETSRAREALARHVERLRILHEIDRAIVSQVAPHEIAEAIIQPLRTLLGVSRVVVNVFDFETRTVEWLAAAGRRRTHVGPGVRYGMHLMGDVEALGRGEAQFIDTHALPPGPEVDALLASDVHSYMAVPMISGGNLIGALSFGGETRSYPPEQLGIAHEVATQLAIAISQSRLLERVRRQSEDLERRVAERTAMLDAANRELEAFSYSVSHDLRAPLRAIDGFSRIVREDYAGKLDDEGRRLLGVIRDNSQKMAQLIDDLLQYSQLGRRSLADAEIDMNRLIVETIDGLRASGERLDGMVLQPVPPAHGDATLVRQALTNLLANAIKFCGKREQPAIEVSGRENGTQCVYCVKDNGAGFDMKYYGKLFGVFQRLHSEEEFTGTGVGLAIVQRVVSRHGGRVWAEGKVDAGAAFYFSLPKRGARGAV